jgi:hypothetical protein
MPYVNVLPARKSFPLHFLMLDYECRGDWLPSIISISQAAAECYDDIVGAYVDDVARQVARKEFEAACNDAIAHVCVAGRACCFCVAISNLFRSACLLFLCCDCKDSAWGAMASAYSHTRLAQSLYDELVTEAARAAANEIARTQHAVMLMEMRSTMLYASTSRFCIKLFGF